VSFKGFDRGDREVTKDFFVHGMVLKVGLDLSLHFFLLRLFLAVFFCAWSNSKRILLTFHLFLAKVPEVNFSVVITCGKLVDIRQVLKAKDEVIHEPWSVLRSISNVFLTLLVPCHFILLTPTRALRGHGVLTGCVVRVPWLWFVVEREE